MSSIAASLLYVPGNKPELFEKAVASSAGAIIWDLEDSVPLAQKDEGIKNLKRVLPNEAQKAVYVRVNHDRLETELPALNGISIAGIMLTKSRAETARYVRANSSADLQLISLVESAAGLAEVNEVAQHSDALAVGRADLLADLRIAESAAQAFMTAIMPLVIASAAHAISAPIAPAYLNVREENEANIHAFSQPFFDMGFRSQTALHPRFCGLINDMMTPSQQAYDEARLMLDTFATQDGVGVDSHGNFVDPAVLRRMKEVVHRYEKR